MSYKKIEGWWKNTYRSDDNSQVWNYETKNISYDVSELTGKGIKKDTIVKVEVKPRKVKKKNEDGYEKRWFVIGTTDFYDEYNLFGRDEGFLFKRVAVDFAEDWMRKNKEDPTVDKIKDRTIKKKLNDTV